MRSKKSTTEAGGERSPWFVTFGAVAGLLFLHIPLLLIFLYAFTTDQAAYTFPPPGLTLKWFPQAVANVALQQALFLTLRVAVLATIVALILGTLAAAAVYRFNFFGREAISFILILPLALPGIVTGIAMRSAISLLHIPFSFWTIIIGHATFCVVVVYNNVVARFQAFEQFGDRSLHGPGRQFLSNLLARCAAQHELRPAGRRHPGLLALV